MGQKKFFANAVKTVFALATVAIISMIFAACSKDNGGNNEDEPDNGEAYVVKSADEKTLTFYYDTQKASRPGTVWDIENKHEGTDFPIWTGTWVNPNKTITQVVFDPSFKEFRPKTTAKWFCESTALTQITGIENLNTSEVTDMGRMFCYCRALTELDVTKFDTKNVTNMYSMFSYCKTLDKLDLTNFDTKKVTTMESMFYGCTALTTIYCNDKWTCSQSEDMFAGCSSLKGAVTYDGSRIDATMANPTTGYFTNK